MLNIQDLIFPINNKKASGFLIKNSSNIFYITFYSGEGYIYVSASGEINLYVDGRYAQRAKREAHKARGKVNINIIGVKEIYKDIAADITKQFKGSNNGNRYKPAVLFESPYFTYEEFLSFKKAFKHSVKLIPSHNALLKIRSLKDKNELNSIKKAVSIAEGSFLNSLRTALDSGLEFSEQGIAMEYKKHLINNNSKESFEAIALSNKNSSMPHGAPSDKKVDKNGILLFDFGAEWNGYKSDETVTMHFGKPDKKFSDVYDAVYSAQQLAISKIKPGVKFKDLDKTARDYIEKKGYGKYFTHSLGHGVGLDIHEYPYVYNKNADTVKEGMVFTVEPGVYLEGEFGVRIEDMCYVKRDGAQVITNIKKKSFYIKDILQ
ncbi:MAG: Xaa-Pro peptidase family protein [Deltaproteobacteria bacterium]|jgi:Xaa-Pro aminopeptidase|nr:Xaa-Pro peptidase family protein [Deltaproteobacteria bacterium]MCL5880357.1 Xaa-Pro peptidase family protein [Deltaproteobacteria bacterium]MDA8303604.1 Xaa-Pro peptidase family protein [Deltaproteobacteria bacterium]